MRRLGLCLLLLLSACATAPQRPPVPVAAPVPAIPAGKAVVHIYRRNLPFGPATLSIYDGNVLVGTLPVGTYLDYYADPGPRTLRIVGGGPGSLAHAASFGAGQTYYFMVYFLGNQDKADANFAPVDAATAIGQMASLKPSAP